MKRSTLGLFTVFASITIAEFTTGSTALTSILTDPSAFFLFNMPANLGLYGCGVILIREAAVRWNKGWPTILMLGIAYGIMEEGISVHTFFSPVTQTVGVFGLYGRFYSLNVTWAILISIFHAVYSIALPILIGNLLWPETRNRRLLTRRSASIIFALYIATVVLLYVLVPYKPGYGSLAGLLVLSGLLVYSSRHLDLRIFRHSDRHSGRSTVAYLIAGLVLFPLLMIFPRGVIQIPSLGTDAIVIAVTLFLYWLLESRLPGNERRKLAVMAVGLLVPLQLFGLLINIRTNPLQILAVVAVAYLEYRILRITGNSRTEPVQPAAM